ncbi:MAG: tRNA pseudouridine(55) synthase TruB [Dialister invisus]
MGCLLPCPFFFGRKWGVFHWTGENVGRNERNPKDCLMTDIKLLLSNLENVSLSEDAAKDFLQGKRLRTALPDMEVTAVFQGEWFLGTAFIENGVLHQRKCFRERL